MKPRNRAPCPWLAGLLPVALSALCLLPTPSAIASVTDRYFADQHMNSPSGTLRLDATSPDNAGEFRRPFAKNFTYSLSDATSGKVRWSRRVEGMRGSPLRVYLSNDGWVVAWVAGSRINIHDPDTGQISLTIRILDQFEEGDRQYIHQTTAGPMWSSFSHWFFHTHEETRYFVVRPFWMDRIVINLTEAETTEPTDELVAELERAERDWARRVLEQTSTSINFETQTAVVIAAQLRDTATAGRLHRIERDTHANATVAFPSPSLDRPMIGDTITSRALAQAGLRRMGVRPSGPIGCVVFGAANTSGGPAPLGPPLRSPANFDRIAVDQTAREVTQLVGLPDALDIRHRRWLYDVDEADPPLTFAVVFGRGKTVTATEPALPPSWEHPADWIERVRW